jgi:hypothetical protein
MGIDVQTPEGGLNRLRDAHPQGHDEAALAALDAEWSASAAPRRAIGSLEGEAGRHARPDTRPHCGSARSPQR